MLKQYFDENKLGFLYVYLINYAGKLGKFLKTYKQWQ